MATHYAILVGSVLGASEYVADALADVIREAGAEVTILLDPDVNSIPADAVWVVCTSTHGAGELPDNIQPFAKELETTDLSGISAYVIGLGDSSYDTFCHGAMTMESLLTSKSATLLAPALHIDVLNHPIPEDKAVAWFKTQIQA